MVAGYRDGGIILAISPPLLAIVLLPSASSSLHDAPRHGAVLL